MEKTKKFKVTKKSFFRIILPSVLAVVLLAGGIGVYFATGPHYFGARHIVSAGSPKEISGDALSDYYIESVKEMGLKLLDESEFEDNNLYSPFSLSVAMSMLLAAAGHEGESAENASETFKQIHKALGLENMTLAEIYANNRIAIEKAYLAGNKVKLSTANSIWYNEDKDRIDLSNTFQNVLKTYFYADFFAQDFNDSASTVKNINKWAKDKTDGMIKEIMKKVNPEDVLIALNAVFFEGEWETQFKKDETAPREFTDGGGNVSMPDFMKSPESAKYKGTDSFSAVKIPYKEGKISFLAALPAEGSTVESLLQDKDAMNLLLQKNWTYLPGEENSEPNAADYYLPKFKFDKEYDLVETMESFGIHDAFVGGLADFSAVQNPDSPRDFYLGSIAQKTAIDLNEERTRAAAVTRWGMKATSVEPQQIPTVYFNRPFFFAIVTDEGLPLFMGTIDKPTY